MDNLYVGNRGYCAIKKQADKDTAITPDVFVPYFNETVVTVNNKTQQNSVKGNRNATQDILQGLRSHGGSVTILGETNSLGYFLDMLMTKGSTTGADPYTHPFTVGDTENYYTMDLKKGDYVERYIGVKANSLTSNYVDNEFRPEISITALKTFKVGTLAGTPTGAGPYTVELGTQYDPAPTTGLVVGDTLIFDDGTTQTEAAIASVVDGTTFTTNIDVTSYGANDTIRIKAQTPSFSLLTPLTWARTEFRFGADAAAALTATHTPLDDGSTFTLTHNNESDEGANTSGSYDPSDLRRTTFDAEFATTKVYTDEVTRQAYLDNDKSAVVIRMFSGNTTDYEFRITLNNIKSVSQDVSSASSEVVKIGETFKPQYDTSDAQALDVKVINAVSSI